MDIDPNTSPTDRNYLYTIVHGDAFAWLRNGKPDSLHAVVTDPPYGLIEY